MSGGSQPCSKAAMGGPSILTLAASYGKQTGFGDGKCFSALSDVLPHQAEVSGPREPIGDRFIPANSCLRPRPATKWRSRKT